MPNLFKKLLIAFTIIIGVTIIVVRIMLAADRNFWIPLNPDYNF